MLDVPRSYNLKYNPHNQVAVVNHCVYTNLDRFKLIKKAFHSRCF